MTQMQPKHKHTEGPSQRQARAADPVRHVWVGASAGTGKTKVLIDRVLRLMLPRVGEGEKSATPPEKILCLTFTKTAAAEMSNRIYAELSKWAVMPDEKLTGILQDLAGARPDETMMHAARRLFARVLDTQGGLKIMTIHAFCQSVLKRFPIEAGLPPHFKLIDEDAANEYLTRCLHDIIAQARNNTASDLAKAFDTLAILQGQDDLSGLMTQVMAKRGIFSAVLEAHQDRDGSAKNTITHVYEFLGVAQNETEESLRAKACVLHTEDEKNLRMALVALIDSKGARNAERAQGMQPFLESSLPARPGLWADYCKAFLKGDGNILSDSFLASGKALDIYPDIVDVMRREAQRVKAVEDKIKALRLAQVNGALLTLSAEMLGRYGAHKKRMDSLDFEDLIMRTCALLSHREEVAWVLFKLDSGIDHILVDEAQDTSPYQWRVVSALADDFLDGQGARDDVVRTLFVVGDEKQSIFSFQGADPAAFGKMREYFGAKVRAMQDGWEVALEHSFRSTAAVLRTVDSVFANDVVRTGIISDLTRDIIHLPFREGHAGLVELWPVVKPNEEKKEDTSWALPTEIREADNAQAKLAQNIAATVAGWMKSGEVLESQGRAIRAGDVLVLVQSRGALVEMMMRAFKDAGVPVAGIDRMTLSEDIAVMDLIALASFALQTRDDLTLATILKSPFIGLDDDDLFGLCHGRAGTLWPIVQEKRPDIAAFLRPLVGQAAIATPYEFFAQILATPCFASAVSGRQALYARLGSDIHDAVDEFLNIALHYEQNHTPALQKFIDWFSRGETEIKREQEGAKHDQVRIMTVHASKGLQAPIVFLPDTGKVGYDHNKARVRFLWPEDEQGVPLWSPRKDYTASAYEDLRVKAALRQDEEYRRLLYVALTRAEDRLYICASQNKRGIVDKCWYNLVQNAFPSEAEKVETAEGVVLRLKTSQTAAPKNKMTPETTAAQRTVTALPAWTLHEPAAEPAPSQPLAPSKVDEEPASKSPLAEDESWKFKRGNIVHRVLELLPQIPQEKWEAALGAYLARPALDIPPQAQLAFAQEILAVMRHAQFAPIFGAGSRAEVPLVGVVGEKGGKPLVMSGQMDRVLITDDEVLIVDFKTNRPPPQDEADVPVVYLKQLAAYAALVRNIYANKRVHCALLWTDGPYLMPISEKNLDPHTP